MKLKKFSIYSSTIIKICLVMFLGIYLQACKSANKNMVEVTTTNMDFQMVDEMPSGWNTFHYTNNSTEPHFFLLDKYPEGKTKEDGKKEVIPVFQEGMDLITEGKMDEAMAAFGKLPSWFQQIVYTGGSGLVSPGKTSQTTLNLAPGYYIMECYVKMPNGMFHATMGMTKAFKVTDKASTNKEPSANIKISISSNNGINYTGAIKKGMNNFSVYYEDQIVHENFLGHDINLVKLEENHNLEELEKWMNWADPKGLISPAPNGVVFLGGVNDMTAGSTGYFTVDLSPGKYAFISEVPNTMQKGLLKTFEVK